MKTVDKISFILNEDIYSEVGENNIIEWLLSLTIKKRKPKDVSKADHELLFQCFDLASKLDKKFNQMDLFILKSKIDMVRMDKSEIEKVYLNKKMSNVIKKNGNTFIKKDSGNYDIFEKNIKNINDFLKTLKLPFYKKVMKNLTIQFVDSKEQKSMAKYLQTYDIISINVKKGSTKDDSYGGLFYIILHELGHRFLKMYPQKWDYDNVKYITTKYSSIDSLPGEEKFAELFALSNWKDKYKMYKTQIEEFEKMVEL